MNDVANDVPTPVTIDESLEHEIVPVPLDGEHNPTISEIVTGVAFKNGCGFVVVRSTGDSEVASEI